MNTTIKNISGIAKRLISESVIDEATAIDALQKSKENRTSIVRELVAGFSVSAQRIAAVASEEFGSPVFDLDTIKADSLPREIVDIRLLRKHHALPLFKRGSRLFLAVSDPTNLRALDEIKFNTGLNTDSVLVEDDKLSIALENYIESQEEDIGDALGGLDDDSLEDLDIEAVDEDGERDDQDSETDEASYR